MSSIAEIRAAERILGPKTHQQQFPNNFLFSFSN